MKEEITTFLEGKNLSENSKTAYFYDLEQFVDVTHAKITETNLRIYQASIADFKPSVQKRKLSAINQFLHYLYKQRLISDFYRLELPKVGIPKGHDVEILDLSDFYADTNQYNGRLIALLILEMGLLPSEILQLKVADVNLDFQIIRIEKAGQKRIVPIPDQLIGELETTLEGTYLLEKNGKSYSRQWGFRQLEAFLIEKNQATLSAQSLREQYILRQREQGVELYEIARNLGLKTMMTLEKYR
ncbi:site-specific tyrosine recombinase XerD [Streptococcus anginosus]|uniref:Tyrosine recombinase XerD-like n=2 Tax=Streptococcus TaxID=1301 RepID=A0AAU7PZE4_9STRE|nr:MULTISPECIES: site-specific tyrosine recombinase XerD [Streptococcus]MBC5617845.1 site-specific tyrosine recombinase XerD [Streptococcus hominis]MCW0925312.1 site-specific tyrosine recombinase XerD [Streptococcus anginosus]QOG24394.1 site-specific tyrosine recombinase XerD [Streptococcus sp. KS 6]